MNSLIARLRRFRDERGWDKFHSPKNLAVSVSIEAAELLELFQWSSNGDLDPERSKNDVAAEAADVIIYALMILDKYGLDPEVEINKKIDANAVKYPKII
ncbi:nucleotide pyrophosphohydrolase [Methylobacterium phyllosphaerae]|uniref:nucleotide pyrophosphohydrolase n=1 Tax=Methylobacterium phyllosphaerae TaxID=418223 RepID=UPI00094D7E79|nr:nucleotide pyrophosphohydrolase [Methylobacterium phyllosphaerae]